MVIICICQGQQQHSTRLPRDYDLALYMLSLFLRRCTDTGSATLSSNSWLDVIVIDCWCVYKPQRHWMVFLQINDANVSMMEQRQTLSISAKKTALEEDEQLQDTMLAAYWAAVNF